MNPGVPEKSQGSLRIGASLRYKVAVGFLLVAATVISLILEEAQTRISGRRDYPFLIFNLGLAWIPMIAALAADLTSRNRITFFVFMPICTLVWLVFFPNAPYLLTDFQHLADTYSNSPLWFDVILLMWFAWTGLLLGISSLALIQEIVTRTFNATTGWAFAILATVLSSIGVYLGRFMRWNSWDILDDPLLIAKDVYGFVRHPTANLPTYAFTILFTLLFLFIYITIRFLGRISRHHREE